jgi:predicted aspartyl protease
MKFSFDATRRLIVVRAELLGPRGSANLELALDTGASWTLINPTLLMGVGYDPAVSQKRVHVTTGSGVEFAPLVSVQQLTALGHSRTNLPVLAHTLPPSASVAGLLGLDFLKSKILTIDLNVSTIEIRDK